MIHTKVILRKAHILPNGYSIFMFSLSALISSSSFITAPLIYPHSNVLKNWYNTSNTSTITKLSKLLWRKDSFSCNIRQMFLENTIDATCLPYHSLEKLSPHYYVIVSWQAFQLSIFFHADYSLSPIWRFSFHPRLQYFQLHGREVAVPNLSTHSSSKSLSWGSLLFTGYIHLHIPLLTHTGGMKHMKVRCEGEEKAWIRETKWRKNLESV